MEHVLDMFSSLGEGLENIASKAGVDAKLTEEASYHYHQELGVTMMVIMIMFIVMSGVFMVIKRVRRNSGGEDLNRVLVESSNSRSVSKNASFQFIDFRRPANLV